MMIDIEKAIDLLKERRKCFVSEADLQLELAWILKDMYPYAYVRCEFVPEFDPSMHIDILVIINDFWIPIELKYKTKGSKLHVGNETYLLKNHGAKDVSCYLFLHDIERIEKVKVQMKEKFSEGYAIMLTNELTYCKPPVKKDCIYAAFSIDEGNTKTGSLDWSENASDGTKKQCSKPIKLDGAYKCHWENYCEIEKSNVGIFKYLLVKI